MYVNVRYLMSAMLCVFALSVGCLLGIKGQAGTGYTTDEMSCDN